MARLLFLPDDDNLLLQNSPLSVSELYRQVQEGRWLPPLPYRQALECGQHVLKCVVCGSLVIVLVEPTAAPSVDDLFAPTEKVTLPERQRQILQYLADGLKTREIAFRLGIAPRTVSAHLSAIKARFGVRTTAQTVGRAAALGLVKMKRRG